MSNPEADRADGGHGFQESYRCSDQVYSASLPRKAQSSNIIKSMTQHILDQSQIEDLALTSPFQHELKEGSAPGIAMIRWGRSWLPRYSLRDPAKRTYRMGGYFGPTGGDAPEDDQV